MANIRKSRYQILPEILHRWSARAMSGRSVSHSELMTLFEAARWAPSARNSQPWRFIYCTHRAKNWHNYLELLDEDHRDWCNRAAALILLISEKSNSDLTIFDTGASWENLAIQGQSMGLVIHPIAMFNHEKSRQLSNIPDNYEVLLMIAVGRPGDIKLLTPELQQREFPKGRKKLSEIVSKEKFNWN